MDTLGTTAYFSADVQALLAEALMNLEANDYYVGESMGDTNTTVNQLKPYSARASKVLITMLHRTTTTATATTLSTPNHPSGALTTQAAPTDTSSSSSSANGKSATRNDDAAMRRRSPLADAPAKQYDTTNDGNPRFWRHPLGLHLYIHLTEPAVPGRGGEGAGWGEDAADLVAALNLTGSGHLEHMPGQ